MAYTPGSRPQPEDRPDNTAAWLLANAGLFAVAAPLAVAYWAGQGYKAVKADLKRMRPDSGPFRDFRRLMFEQQRQAKTGIPASTEVYLPMRLDRSDRDLRPSDSPRAQAASMPPALAAAVAPRRDASPGEFRRTVAPRAAQEMVLPRVYDRRVDVRVPFADREEAKGFGVRWDPEAKTWYAPAGVDLGRLQRWLPYGIKVDMPEEAAPTAVVVHSEIAAARVAKQAEIKVEEDALVPELLAAEEEELPPVEAYADEMSVG